MQNYDCIIVGAGAAGLMCAATAAQRGRRVLVLERANKVGKKILMSGGGRCNFTNVSVGPEHYISANSHFCKSALSRYTQHDFIDLVRSYDLAFHEKTLGQLFCDQRSRDVLDILLAECAKGCVTLQTLCDITAIKKLPEQAATSAEVQQNRYALNTSQGQYSCCSLVIASGGPSVPTLGSSGYGYEVAKQFGLSVTPLDASLVPFVLQNSALKRAQSLAGVSLPIAVTCGSMCFKEALLFTHKGLSGPAILQISNYWHAGETISIDFLPDVDLTQRINDWKTAGEKAELKNLLSRLLPKRFVIEWLDMLDPQFLTQPLAQLNKEDIKLLATHFQHWTLVPSGTEGYKTAEVTRGGVSTAEVSSKTFECKRVAGLYFIGEVLDVTGWLGGYNFQWAWSSGCCAGQYV